MKYIEVPFKAKEDGYYSLAGSERKFLKKDETYYFNIPFYASSDQKNLFVIDEKRIEIFKNIGEWENDYKWDDYSEELQQAAVKAIYHWQFKNTYCFNDKILTLFQTADFHNLYLLRKGFNLLYCAYELWYNSEGNNGEQLFIDHGLMENEK